MQIFQNLLDIDAVVAIILIALMLYAYGFLHFIYKKSLSRIFEDLLIKLVNTQNEGIYTLAYSFFNSL